MEEVNHTHSVSRWTLLNCNEKLLSQYLLNGLFDDILFSNQKWHPLQVKTLELHVKHHTFIWNLCGNLGPVGLLHDCMPSIYSGTMVPSHVRESHCHYNGVHLWFSSGCVASMQVGEGRENYWDRNVRGGYQT